jgi:hypothetical protein
MSKTKLALVVFLIAFGVNGLAFLFSKKSFTVDEVKNVWIYELPLSASPLDSYVALDLGPHQGVVGTLFSPNHLRSNAPLALFLAEAWKWDQAQHVLSIEIKHGLKFQNGDPILPASFVLFRDYLKQRGVRFGSDPLWNAWLDAKIETYDSGLRIHLSEASRQGEFDLQGFLSEVLTHPLSGAIHSANLEEIKKGAVITKGWISSGPYKIRKWNPKEIVMVSRDDFLMRMPDPFFRTLKFQSAPVKNPSCDFLLGQSGEGKTLGEHSSQETSLQLSVFWVCRSFRNEGICADDAARSAIMKALQGEGVSAGALAGKKVRFRIPVGSESFRNEIREAIQKKLTAAGGVVEETSYFFKSSKDTDLELQFVVTPEAPSSRQDFAMSLARLSSRIGVDAYLRPNLMGEVAHFPLQVFMKKMKGEMFGKVFLEPDVEEKALHL